ncbi:PREDICTED: uncharacterized protein K02A2.6-like [Priapulus caudatus]|uniref:Uncharacterized protein K02A2.6-like n=1 Tax=Priapulus caudatus TaxID=37621 RepID=A0ABM1ETS9_PRICU|nr:PREDICTED: uncharacterized protein K02A2.6-like [Priapulus caudatus]
MAASGGAMKDDAIQTAIFLHVIGEPALEVYNGFTWAEAGDANDLAKIRLKFKDYCIPRTNVTFERHRFFTTVQKPGETIDHFVTELRTRAKTCEFGILQDGLIRDRVICGIPSNTLRQRLLREEKLTLAKAIDICRAEEATRSQVGQLSGEAAGASGSCTSCDAVYKRQPKSSDESKGYNSRNQEVKKDSCKFCGYRHRPNACPAYGKQCIRCGKIGHFIKCCPNSDKRKQGQKVHAVETEYDIDNEQSDEFFVDTVNTANTSQSWIVPLDINGTVLPMKLDTGANANIISEHDFCSIGRKPKLHTSKVKLTAYAGHDVPVKGQCIMNIEHKGKVSKALFIVTQEPVHPILGLQECEKLRLVRRVWQVDAENQEDINTDSEQRQSVNTESHKRKTSGFCDSVRTEYADIFKGLGCLPGIHKIRLDDAVTPVVEPCRKVPFGLHDKLKEELDRMESLDVITKIDEPTEWVSSLVIVHKKTGQIRVCLDPKNLNKAIRREHFKLPTREEIMSKFAGAKVFTKLDASSGFWQLRLDEDSSKVCTFSTPFGRYRYLRLPFGISSAPEVYHRTIYNMFSDIPGVDTSMDDVIIQGASQEEHDASLKRVLDKAREENLRLNADKCVISVSELTFIGDVISDKGVKPDSTKIEAIHAMDRPTNKKELQRFLGMVTYLAKFVPDLSTETAPLRSLLHHKTQWESNMTEALTRLKRLCLSR